MGCKGSKGDEARSGKQSHDIKDMTLHDACIFGDPTAIKHTVKGDDINLFPSDTNYKKSRSLSRGEHTGLEQFPIQLAMQSGREGAVRAVLEKGGDLSLEQDHENIFHVGAAHDNLAGVAEAIQWARDHDDADSGNGEKKMDIIKKLLNPDNSVLTPPLLIAVAYGSRDMVTVFCHAGADPTQKDRFDRNGVELAKFWKEAYESRRNDGFSPRRQGIDPERYNNYDTIVQYLTTKIQAVTKSNPETAKEPTTVTANQKDDSPTSSTSDRKPQIVGESKPAVKTSKSNSSSYSYYSDENVKE